MSENRIMYLQSMLEQMETHQLDEMLQAELQKEHPDAHAVQMILSVLEKREKDYPVETDPGIEQAWQEYIRKTSEVPKRVKRGLLLRVASFAVILAILFLAMPQQVEAESIWERLARWTDSVFELFSLGDRSAEPAEYVFHTDNPGLQQVYDAVVELGITDPVVPMWLPDGYELVELKTTKTPIDTYIFISFSKDNSNAGYRIDIYSDIASRKYYKDENVASIFEKNGVIHYIIKNDSMWTVIWVSKNIECSLTIDCQEDVLYRILRSIYMVEGY